ncbi:S1 RNA-binding domain-containing protein [Prochlorococcus sp. MIT 1300]|uniref:S1 RNA-binding domain-containing protein n=1 Tax=Prochlorococcus sp. MIT 1300 TaxID=3096218 RepID=UPI002A74CECB|nr:S1 RNA-binding domain-containing protein [Prochlorococcus sp. MIT 1300]
MAGSGSSPKSNQPIPPKPPAEAARKPLQVMHISRRDEKAAAPSESNAEQETANETNKSQTNTGKGIEQLSNVPSRTGLSKPIKNDNRFDLEDIQGVTMGDLLGNSQTPGKYQNTNSAEDQQTQFSRSVDDFDFDEDAFLAALDENEPIGSTGEVAKGSVIGVESDGVYVDIGGKAPGFMPKNECGLGVITNLKEKFPKGLEVEVLVTRDQNADGMVTISCRALALRKSWDKVREMEAKGQVVQVKINGFNRGGVTCDLEGLRGFIPRSQLEHGEEHESLVGKSLGVAFLEVNPDTRKLVLSEKRATIAARFAQLEIGQLVEGKVVAIKPYGFFVDLGGVSGLLHQSVITNGSLRSLREVFTHGDQVKALITELDPGRGRIGLNTALLEGPPGEILIEKDKLMQEASERANKVRNLLKQEPVKEEINE